MESAPNAQLNQKGSITSQSSILAAGGGQGSVSRSRSASEDSNEQSALSQEVLSTHSNEQSALSQDLLNAIERGQVLPPQTPKHQIGVRLPNSAVSEQSSLGDFYFSSPELRDARRESGISQLSGISGLSSSREDITPVKLQEITSGLSREIQKRETIIEILQQQVSTQFELNEIILADKIKTVSRSYKGLFKSIAEYEKKYAEDLKADPILKEHEGVPLLTFVLRGHAFLQSKLRTKVRELDEKKDSRSKEQKHETLKIYARTKKAYENAKDSASAINMIETNLMNQKVQAQKLQDIMGTCDQALLNKLEEQSRRMPELEELYTTDYAQLQLLLENASRKFKTNITNDDLKSLESILSLLYGNQILKNYIIIEGEQYMIVDNSGEKLPIQEEEGGGTLIQTRIAIAEKLSKITLQPAAAASSVAKDDREEGNGRTVTFVMPKSSRAIEEVEEVEEEEEEVEVEVEEKITNTLLEANEQAKTNAILEPDLNKTHKDMIKHFKGLPNGPSDEQLLKLEDFNSVASLLTALNIDANGDPVDKSKGHYTGIEYDTDENKFKRSGFGEGEVEISKPEELSNREKIDFMIHLAVLLNFEPVALRQEDADAKLNGAF
jgi:hypothetical protein